MSESGDYSYGPWTGHDFKDAYKSYDAHAGRSYADATSKSIKTTDCLSPEISTNCENPLLILTDVTGSMGEWPKTIFSKLPYLELEAKEYLGKDLEIAFGAIGDANSDSYPLQMRPFDSGVALKDRMLELIIEGGGGGQMCETYELAALYCLHKVAMPKAIRPILILIGDEKAYSFISREQAAEVCGITLEKGLSVNEVFRALKQRYSVYLIRKPYRDTPGNDMSAEDRDIREQWISLLGNDHVCELPDAKRVVDVIFGILAQETARIDYFRGELEGRQKPDQVKTVYKSLKTIHRAAPKPEELPGKSILKLEDGGRKAKKLS